MSKFLVAILFMSSVLVACSDNNSEDIADKTNAPQGQPAEYPKATGEWVEARTFMMRQQDDGQECDQVDLRVMANSGVFSLSQCDHTKSGQLTAAEFTQLDSLATRAYKQTESRVCPEIFRFNKFYAEVNSSKDEFDRTFDPDHNCYSGDKGAVDSYKQFLHELVDRYRDSTAGPQGL